VYRDKTTEVSNTSIVRRLSVRRLLRVYRDKTTEVSNTSMVRRLSFRRLRFIGMNTYELDRLTRRFATRFDGVFSCDRLPTKPTLFVCNTDPSYEPGKHWIAIYVADDERYGEFFDSLGREPNRLFESYMNEHCRVWTFNPAQIQSVVSRFCGHYCACFCILRSRGVDLSRCSNYFTRDTGLNDVVVHGLLYKILND